MGADELKENEVTIEPQLSIKEIAKKLENEDIAVDSLDKVTIQGCVCYWKKKQYSDRMIGTILGKDQRTIRRYMKTVRDSNSLRIEHDFQRKYLTEKLQECRFIREQYLEMLRLGDSSIQEKVKVANGLQQIAKNEFAFLEKLGYINDQITSAERTELLRAQDELKRKREKKKQIRDKAEPWKYVMSELNTDQNNEIYKTIDKCDQEAREKIDRLIDKFDKQNHPNFLGEDLKMPPMEDLNCRPEDDKLPGLE